MNQEVSVSVILPVYNGEPYLKTAVESVLNQTFQNFELLIVDDVSTDGSLSFLGSVRDNRIRLFTNETNRGLFYNLNFLIRKASSPLIKLWSQDDIMYPDCLEKIVTFHQSHPEVGFSYSGRDIIDENGKIITLASMDNTPEIITREVHTRIAFFTGSIAGNIANVTLTRKAIDETGFFNEDMMISGDFDRWVHIAEKFPVGFIRDKLIALRDHPGQLSRQPQYALNHLKEDILVYNYLLQYTDEKGKKDGRLLLRNHKLVFYYTLMVKSFMKGYFKTGLKFLGTLGRFDNLIIMSWYFFRNKIFFKTRYRNMHLDNRELFD